MSLANLVIHSPGWGNQPLARIVRLERSLGRAHGGYNADQKRCWNQAVRQHLAIARKTVAAQS